MNLGSPVHVKYAKFIKIHLTCEPNLCEAGSRDFPVDFDFRFTFVQSSHSSREPVNLGSHITNAPIFI
jgi:hypothetical protein